MHRPALTCGGTSLQRTSLTHASSSRLSRGSPHSSGSDAAMPPSLQAGGM